jgi:hypothetical protein
MPSVGLDRFGWHGTGERRSIATVDGLLDPSDGNEHDVAP